MQFFTTGGQDIGNGTIYSLFAFPAKDNYEGRLYPLDWIAKVGLSKHAEHALWTTFCASTPSWACTSQCVLTGCCS